MDHPVATLRARLSAEFSADLPEGVHPVPQFCGEPQFFPGATGLLRQKSWAEVVPGVGPVSDGDYPDQDVRVMVVGNYQATWASYQRILAGEIGGFPTTWRRLRFLLAGIPPTEVFLTNAYIGLPDLDDDTAPFPTKPDFDHRCERLLALEIDLFRPKCVVCLGVPAARMVATTCEGLDAWRPWPGYRALTTSGGSTVPTGRLGEARFTAVAVAHPSAVIPAAARHDDAERITRAAGPVSLA